MVSVLTQSTDNLNLCSNKLFLFEFIMYYINYHEISMNVEDKCQI